MPTPLVTLYEAYELVASAARTVTANGDAVFLVEGHTNLQALVFSLDVTVDESTAADKLNVFIQSKLDGTNWTDIAHFTEHDGNAGAERYYSKVVVSGAEAEFLNSAALAEATVRDMIGQELRARWAITDDSGSASYTFSVTATPM